MQAIKRSTTDQPVDVLKARVVKSADALKALISSTGILMSADGSPMMFNKGFTQFSKTNPRN